MGCGSSKTTAVEDNRSKPQHRPQPQTTQKVEVKPMAPNRQPLEPIKAGSINHNDSQNREAAPSYAAFEISLSDKNARGLNSNIDTLLSRPIGGRNTMLEPLAQKSGPMNTEFADPEVEKKRQMKQRQLSRRRSELMSARRRAQTTGPYDDEEEEFNGREDPAVAAEILESKMMNAERAREMKLREIQEKQRLRDERARQARERAQQNKMNGDNGFDADDTYELGRKSTMTRRDDDDYNYQNRPDSPATPTPDNQANKQKPIPSPNVKKVIENQKRALSPDASSGYNSREVSASSQADAAHVDIRSAHQLSTYNEHRDSPRKTPSPMTTHDQRSSSDSDSKSKKQPARSHKQQEWDDNDDDLYRGRDEIHLDGGRQMAVNDEDDEEEFY